MKAKFILTLIAAGFGAATPSQAGLIIDNHLSFLDSRSSTVSSESYSKYNLSLSIGASIPKIFFLGWKTTTHADWQKGSAGTAKISGLEMGPRLGVFLTKNKWTSFTTTYLPVYSATQTTDTGTVTKLSGSGFEFEFTFAPEVFKHLSPGISLLYHLGGYSSATASGGATSTVSYSRNVFIPSIYLHWVFGSLD
jgi:hypothetical protein